MKKLVSQCNSAANGCVCPSFLTTIEPYGTGTYTVFAQNLRQWMSLPFCLIPGNCVSFSADKHWWLLQSHLPNNKRQMLVAVFLVQRGRGYRFFIMVVLGHYPHICAFFFYTTCDVICLWGLAALTLGPLGPVDGPVLTQGLERLLQRGHVHLTGCQHSQELRLPLGLIPRQLEMILQRTVSQHLNRERTTEKLQGWKETPEAAASFKKCEKSYSAQHCRLKWISEGDMRETETRAAISPISSADEVNTASYLRSYSSQRQCVIAPLTLLIGPDSEPLKAPLCSSGSRNNQEAHCAAE